jgi:hypothetical protein
MIVGHRNYTAGPGISDDYFKVRDFLLKLYDAEFTYARWDWMITHSMLDKEAIKRIGIWEEGDRVVGMATFDTQIGPAYCLTLPEYAVLKREMIDYAAKNLTSSCRCRIMIPQKDDHFQQMVSELGFHAGDEKEHDLVFFPAHTSLDYTLPDGFRVASMKDHYDP